MRRNLTVSGVVTGISACAPLVAYQYGETPDRVSMGNSRGRVDAGGRFSFENLAPGQAAALRQVQHTGAIGDFSRKLPQGSRRQADAALSCGISYARTLSGGTPEEDLGIPYS